MVFFILFFCNSNLESNALKLFNCIIIHVHVTPPSGSGEIRPWDLWPRDIFTPPMGHSKGTMGILNIINTNVLSSK